MNAPLRRFIVVGFSLFVLVASQVALYVPESSGEYTITTEKEFRTYVAGKKNVSQSGYSIIHGDGSITGNFRDMEMTGNWTWEGNFFCRSVQLDGKDLPDDCQVVIVSDDKVSFIRNKGEGKRANFRMQEP